MRDASDPIELVVSAHVSDLEGFGVSRALPHHTCRAVGPVVFLDHIQGQLAPGKGFDVRPHPHIGLSTFTYLLEGEFVHRDSLGIVKTITPGAINLMTAGSGITHSERTSPEVKAAGARMHGIQLWIAMPAANEDDDPAFAHHPKDTLPSATFDGGTARVLLGEALGASSPATTASQATVVDLSLAAGTRFVMPEAIEDLAIYVLSGELAHGDERFGPHTLVVRRPGASLTLDVPSETRAVLVGGPRLEGITHRDPRVIEWNFVASSRERIEAAKKRWRARGFPSIPGDDEEFIPLPGDRPHA